MPRPLSVTVAPRFPIRTEKESGEREAFLEARGRYYDPERHEYRPGYVLPDGYELHIRNPLPTRTVTVVEPLDPDGPPPAPPSPEPGHTLPGSHRPRPRPGPRPGTGPKGKPIPPVREIEVPDIPDDVASFEWLVRQRGGGFSHRDVAPVERRRVGGVEIPGGDVFQRWIRVPVPGRYDVRVRQRTADERVVDERTASLHLRDHLVVSLGDSYASGQGNPDVPGMPEREGHWYDILLPALGFTVSVASGAVLPLAPLAYAFGKDALETARDRIKREWATAGRKWDWSIDMDPEPVWLEPKAYRSLRAGPALAASAVEDPPSGRLVTYLSFARTGAEVVDGLLGPRREDGRSIDGWIGHRGEIEEMEATLRGAGRDRIDALLLSIGGNDVGFAATLTRLVRGDLPAILDGEGDNAENRRKTRRRVEEIIESGALRTAFEQLRDRLEGLSLEIGSVLLTEYPTAMFDGADGTSARGCGIFESAFDLNVDRRDAEITREMAERLNVELRRIASDFGWTWVGGVADGFAGHGYCLGENSFYRSAEGSFIIQGDTEGTMHPDAAGHAVYGERIAQLLDRVLAHRGDEAVLVEPRAGTVADVREEWVPVPFAGRFGRDPVLLASIQTFHGPDPAVARVRALSGGGFQVRVEEEKAGEPHPNAEEVGFVALPAGPLHDRGGERIGFAGFLEADQPEPDAWHRVEIEDIGSGEVVVFAQVVSAHGHQPVHTRLRQVRAVPGDGASFRFRLEEWPRMDRVHVRERVAYLAVREGVHQIEIEGGGRMTLAVSTVSEVDHRWRRGVEIPGALQRPVVLTRCQTFRGPHPVVTRQSPVGGGGLDLRLQEGRGGGPHTTERVGVLAVAATE